MGGSSAQAATRGCVARNALLLASPTREIHKLQETGSHDRKTCKWVRIFQTDLDQGLPFSQVNLPVYSTPFLGQ